MNKKNITRRSLYRGLLSLALASSPGLYAQDGDTPTPTANLGYDSFFMGHSFFIGQVNRLPGLAAKAGLTEHVQQRYGSGGETGLATSLWNDPENSANIKAILDGGGIELFGMVIDRGVDGYMSWIDYALESNPLKHVMIGMNWVGYPSQMTLNQEENQFEANHSMLHDQIDTLRSTYPDLEFFCIPYGKAAVELRALYEAGNLPQITAFTGPEESSLHVDSIGHAGKMLHDTTTMIWLSAIYGVDLLTLNHNTGWQIDAQLKQIATDILAGHDPAYNFFSQSNTGGGDQEASFNAWATGYGLVASNSLKTADLEPDGLDNWTEYLFGGDPNVNDASTILPSCGMITESGINWLEYVYRRRSNYQALGLTYTVESTPNLNFGTWTTDDAIGSGTNHVDTEIESVTNRVSMETLPEQFIRLRVE